MYLSSKCSRPAKETPSNSFKYSVIWTIEGTASLTLPKNSRQTVLICSGILCRINLAEVIKPSHPSFWTPGSPLKNLSVTSLPNPAFLKLAPDISRISGFCLGLIPFSSNLVIWNLTVSVSWTLPKLWANLSISTQSPLGSTIFQEARLSRAVPQRTAFFPPAFIATFPPMHEASAEVGSVANSKPAFDATSIALLVTSPAPQWIVGTVWVTPGKFLYSTWLTLSSFSVFITTDWDTSGIAPPV